MASADPFPPTSLSICDTKIQHSPSWKTLARRVQKNMYTYATREEGTTLDDQVVVYRGEAPFCQSGNMNTDLAM